MSYKPISDYGLIGNMLSAALVSKDGSIDWCCLPRFDSPSVFAAILDDEKGGAFHIRPKMPYTVEQSYVQNTNVLETVFKTDSGMASVTDFMPCYPDSRGRPVRLREIHRLVECRHGEVELEAVFNPKLDYARGSTALSVSEYGTSAENGSEAVALSTSVPFTIGAQGALGQFTLRKGERACFVLHSSVNKPRHLSRCQTAKKLEATIAHWNHLANNCLFSGPWLGAILRSYLVLHLMVYSPTGAIVAAPTTSLPEAIGGERNWDYRYAWLRDASWTVNAFSYLGHGDEAGGFMNWLLSVCDKCGPRAQILYDIDFGDPPDELTFDHLKGYRDSRPVRIGNDAYQQRQLDVYGEVAEAAYNHLIRGGSISRHAWGLIESFVDAAGLLWTWPDSGIWEVRGGPFHFVHSKLMCWVAVDRGIKMAEILGRKKNLARWAHMAEEIKYDILTKGWNDERQAFTQHYDTTALDASNLLMPIYDFLPISDQRVQSTFERTVAELKYDGLLRRYNPDETEDGIRGPEGAFLWCSFWLVRNYIRLGRLDEALSLYETLLGYGNHLGLLSEMVDPNSGELLGNFPQALTHLAVIIAGVELSQAVDKDKKQKAD